jgi:cytochrome d ubiquinol oxidase subunit I
VVTGIVQEFQFGMNWSDYSRFVGDVFGAPLAMEGLLAFFLESTFLGLWIFGWDRLPQRLHLATMWLASIGTIISAYFILAANSFMQHPVGYRINPETNRAELTSIWKVLTNSTTLVAFPHTIFACFMTGGAVVIGVSAWHLYKKRDAHVHRLAMKIALVVTLIAGVGVAISGDLQARVMTEQQPMKMAAAEALYNTSQPASFSLFTVGTLDGSKEVLSIRVPHVLSFMATGDLNGKVEGINNIQQQYVETYGPGDYRPIIAITYWSFRFMIGVGMAGAALAAAGLWLMRRGRTPQGRWFYRLAVLGIAFPFVANSMGWIFTEMGRQPWLVFGHLQTKDGVSPSVAGGTVLTSLVTFTLLYGVLAVVDGMLMVRAAKQGVPTEIPSDESEREPVFAY